MALADQPGQPDGAPVDEGDAEAPAVHAEHGVGGGHPEVAPQRQLEPSGHGVALDGGDDGLGEVQPGGPHGPGPVLGHGPAVALGQGLEVRPGAEASLPPR